MRLPNCSLLFFVTSSLLLPACGDGSGDSGSSGDPVTCTLEARSSVQVTVVDVMGIPALDATVTFSVDGGVEEDAECVSTAAAGGCEAWVAGYERAGVFVIKAMSADGTAKAEESVTVAKDECHVISQMVELKLM
jgi:hypothetical protein